MSHTYESRTPREGTASGVSVRAAKLDSAPLKKPDRNFKDCVSHEAARPYPASSQAPFAAHAMLPARGVWERDDAYPFIVRSGDLRVIECKDAIQWILQRRRRNGKWRDLGYFRNRDVLIERSGLDELRALPHYHLGRELSAPNRLLIAAE